MQTGGKQMTLMAMILALPALVACATPDYTGSYGQYGGNYPQSSMVVQPCTPFYADEIMYWAKELDGARYHDRQANVRVDGNGQVWCTTREAAGSRSSQ